MTVQPRKGDRVIYRGRTGTVVDDYWKDRDRYSVVLDGSTESLDFGAGSLTLVDPTDAIDDAFLAGFASGWAQGAVGHFKTSAHAALDEWRNSLINPAIPLANHGVTK